MSAVRSRSRHGFHWLSKTAFTLLVLCATTNVACPQLERPQVRGSLIRGKTEFIEPGTIIENTPPEGWTHLVIKTHPKPGPGDLGRVTSGTYQLASFIFTAFLANVRAEVVDGETRHRIDRVGVGLGTKVNGRDMIVTPQTQKRLGANLGILARVVLEKAAEKQEEVRVAAHAPTFALIDTPALMLRGNKHRPIVIRYALLVEERSGRLDTLCWLIDRDRNGRYVGPASPMEWLAKNLVMEVPLHVDGNEYTLGIPSDNAFAMTRIPKGQRQILFSEELAALAGLPRITSAQAIEMENLLRNCLR